MRNFSKFACKNIEVYCEVAVKKGVMDEELRQLIKQVSKSEANSLERAKAIPLLILKIQQLPGFYKSSHQDYFDALDLTWEWLGNNIKNFQERPPSLPVSLVRWVNAHLYWRIKDIKEKRDITFSLDTPVNNDGIGTTYKDLISDTSFKAKPPCLTGLDSYIEQIQEEQINDIAQKLKNYIDEDPHYILRKFHLQKNPQCNFQVILQKLYLKDKPDTKRALAQEFGVSEQTLSSYYGRNWLKIQSHLQEIASSFGLETDYLS